MSELSNTTKRQLTSKDSARITCQTVGCDAPATVCHTVHWDTGNTQGVSFFYHCQRHTDDTRGEK